jgi:AP-1-like factor
LRSPPATNSESGAVSPFNSLNQVAENKNSPFSLNADSPLDKQNKDDLAAFTGIFSPPLTTNTIANASRSSLDSLHYSAAPTNTSSPSASSHSNMGPSSSCGTSPEPFTQSPMGFKPIDTLTTIGEEQGQLNDGNQGFSQFAGININSSFDWLAQQNGGQFDPQLFGNYRDTQENILGATTFDDSFFNEAIDADFLTPYNMAPSPAVSKKSLIAEIDAKNEADDAVSTVEVTGLSANKMWEKLQNCPKVQNGEFDLDGLCTDLQKKAKCSGNGPIVAEKDFQEVVHKWMGKKCSEEAAANRV